jgi:hypothetical protein
MYGTACRNIIGICRRQNEAPLLVLSPNLGQNVEEQRAGLENAPCFECALKELYVTMCSKRQNHRLRPSSSA